jgi:hypothetical protein
MIISRLIIKHGPRWGQLLKQMVATGTVGIRLLEDTDTNQPLAQILDKYQPSCLLGVNHSLVRNAQL